MYEYVCVSSCSLFQVLIQECVFVHKWLINYRVIAVFKIVISDDGYGVFGNLKIKYAKNCKQCRTLGSYSMSNT